MVVSPARPAPPSDDRRWRIVDTRMRRLGHGPEALIEVLHAAQEAFGYLEPEALAYVAASLGVPLSKVYGVATFYSFFTLRPQGEHTCVVCTGTACYIKGAGALVEGIEERYGVQPGGTTDDKALSVMAARCVGVCGLAPAAVVDGTLLGKLTPPKLLERIAQEIAE